MTRPRKDPDYEAGFKAADYKQVSREQLAAEYGDAKPLPGIPTTMTAGDGHVRLPMAPTRVITPDSGEVELYGDQRAKICGHCKFFDLETGRRELVRQRFGERLVREYEWQLKHVGDLDALGLCGASGGEMATQFPSKACDQYRPK